jgi:hypothetical protein
MTSLFFPLISKLMIVTFWVGLFGKIIADKHMNLNFLMEFYNTSLFAMRCALCSLIKFRRKRKIRCHYCLNVLHKHVDKAGVRHYANHCKLRNALYYKDSCVIKVLRQLYYPILRKWNVAKQLIGT